MAKKSFVKLHGAMALMMKRIGDNLSNDSETKKVLEEGKQNLEVAYTTRFSGLIHIINAVKSVDQLCMLGDLARYMRKFVDLNEEYQRTKDMPEEDMYDRLYHMNRHIAWLAKQIEHYNMPAEDINYNEECCAYYEYPTVFSDAKITLKIQRVYMYDWYGRRKTHTEITVTAQCKTYFKVYNVASYDPTCYDKSDLVEAVKDTIDKAVNELELG